MAGLGRRTHYRKHLTDSIIYDFPEPNEKERIAKVVATRGSNQFDIILPVNKQQEEGDDDSTRESHLAILPTKFNKLVWVKRNDFVIVETGGDDDDNSTDKTNNKTESQQQQQQQQQQSGIRYIISHILYKDQVKHLQSKGLWPKTDVEFATDKIGLRSSSSGDEEVHNNNDASNDDAVSGMAGEGNEEATNYNKQQYEEDDDGIVYDMGYEDDDFLVNTNRLAALKVDDSSESESSDEE